MQSQPKLTTLCNIRTITKKKKITAAKYQNHIHTYSYSSEIYEKIKFSRWEMHISIPHSLCYKAKKNFSTSTFTTVLWREKSSENIPFHFVYKIDSSIYSHNHYLNRWRSGGRRRMRYARQTKTQRGCWLLFCGESSWWMKITGDIPTRLMETMVWVWWKENIFLRFIHLYCVFVAQVL